MASVQKIRTKARGLLNPQKPQAPIAHVHKHSQAQLLKQAVPVQATMLEEATAQDQIINQQQSLALVQAMLLVSISSFCFLRNILPPNHFEDRSYNSICDNARWPYQELLGDKVQGSSFAEEKSDKEPNRQPSTLDTDKIKVLARGSSKSADKILFWIDGITEALKRNVLAAVKFCVILDKTKPENIIESYSFAFQYTTNPGSAETTLKSMLLTGSCGESVTVSSTRADIAKINRTLIILTQDLPHLPKTRYLTCNMSCTSDCPTDYTPPGFRHSRSEVVFVPDNDQWKMEETHLGQMDSGYHRVDLKGAHLLPVDNIDSDSQDHCLRIPSKIDYIRQMPRFECSMVDEGFKPHLSLPTVNPGVLRVTEEGSQMTCEKDTLSCNYSATPVVDLEFDKKLQKMVPSASLPEGYIQTQPVVCHFEGNQLATYTTENSTQPKLKQAPMTRNEEEVQESLGSELDTTEGETDELVAFPFTSSGSCRIEKSESKRSRLGSTVSSTASFDNPRPVTRSQKKRLHEEEILPARKRVQWEISPISMKSRT